MIFRLSVPLLMAKIHVLLKKEELDGERLPGKAVIVLDILFATSTIVTALAHGAREVIPTLDRQAALLEAQRLREGDYVLSGELYAETLPGFAHPTPLALTREPLAGTTLIYSTTNGTVALTKAAEADHVYAAALLNGPAVVDHISKEHPDSTVLIVCAGSADNFNLEDFYGAGYLASLFSGAGEHELTDAALAARLLHEKTDAMDCLLGARVGRMMQARGLAHEVEFAAQKARYAVVPRLVNGRLRGC